MSKRFRKLTILAFVLLSIAGLAPETFAAGTETTAWVELLEKIKSGRVKTFAPLAKVLSTYDRRELDFEAALKAGEGVYPTKSEDPYSALEKAICDLLVNGNLVGARTSKLGDIAAVARFAAFQGYYFFDFNNTTLPGPRQGVLKIFYLLSDSQRGGSRQSVDPIRATAILLIFTRSTEALEENIGVFSALQRGAVNEAYESLIKLLGRSDYSEVLTDHIDWRSLVSLDRFLLGLSLLRHVGVLTAEEIGTPCEVQTGITG